MEQSMNSTQKLTPEVADGSQKKQGKRLRPWQVAQLLLEVGEGKQVDVEHATDMQFEQFIEQAGIPVDTQNIAEWSFDDRCGVIYWAMERGIELPFAEIKNTPEVASESA